jgi:CHAT domain-containing protein
VRPRDAPGSVPDPPWILISPPAEERGNSESLAGSFLTPREITGLNLDTNLVILSGCDTAARGQTAGEGLLSGLGRAFIQAGARSLIVTYWDAQYMVAEQIMDHITAGLAENPSLSAARAISIANRNYFSNATGLRRLPYFWAYYGAVGPRPGAFHPVP